MIIRTTIAFSVHDYELRSVLAAIGSELPPQTQQRELLGRVHFRVPCPLGSDDRQLQQALAEAGLSLLITREAVYSDAELSNADLLFLHVGLKPLSLATMPTRYDGGCPQCGTGGKQIDALRIEGKYFHAASSPVLATSRGHILLRKDVMERCPASMSVRPIEMGTCDPARQLYQLCSAGVLPPMESESTGVRQQFPCPECDRDGYCYTLKEPFVPRYRPTAVRSRFSSWPPMTASTYECFGNSMGRDNVRRYGPAQPLIAINQTVRRAILSVAPDAASLVWTPLQFE